ncbi:hypothetical protein [Rossellomorea vietnamensis]|uniref:hypothetical protein n=1 Tax=Rossellomorea vietnamensis TaxID=218284 RepID=UPI000556AD94|nr:hypothetical protein [Rossellomorea vietnamensis]
MKKNVNVGYTVFKPTGVKHEFTKVDLTKKQLTGIVLYNGIIYMTVLVDLVTDTVSVEGSIDELDGLAMDYDSYIDMFKSQAAFFVTNQISDPEKYYDEMI